MLHYCTADLRRQGFRSEREAVLLKHGVDLVMTGHSHNYARTCQLNNYTCAWMSHTSMDGSFADESCMDEACWRHTAADHSPAGCPESTGARSTAESP